MASEFILDSIKKLLGIGAEYDVFDADIITHINTTLLNLQQLGIGPAEGFMIEDDTATWNAFLGVNSSPLLNSVKSYIYFKVKLAFDPPAMSFHLASLEKQIQELEWRMLIIKDELGPPTLDLTIVDVP